MPNRKPIPEQECRATRRRDAREDAKRELRSSRGLYPNRQTYRAAQRIRATEIFQAERAA